MKRFTFLLSLFMLPAFAFAAAPAFSMQSYGVDEGPLGVTSGDLNGDGRPDLLTANLVNGTLSILFNNGDGTYQEPYTPFAVGPTKSAKIADMTGDGIMDIIATSETLGGAVLVHPGLGDGTFFSAIETPLGENGLNSIELADFNNDGKIDAVVPFPGSDSVRVLIGNGDGSFGVISTLSSLGEPNFTQTGDLNGDGNIDLIIAHRNAAAISVFLGNGDGTFGSETRYSVGPSVGASPVHLGDVDNDGDLDAAVGVLTGTIILENQGDGSFADAASSVNDDYPIGLADMDADGNVDLVSVSASAGAVSIMMGNGDGTFSGETFYPGTFPGGAFEIVEGAIDHLNNDGKLDIAVPNFGVNRVTVLLSTQALPHPTSKDQCKHGGYKNYVDDQNKPFKNQGKCISYVNHH